MPRPALTAAVTAFACLVGAGGASACVIQGGGASPVGGEPTTPVHPGSPMQVTISKLDGGATYTVTVGGTQVLRKTKPAGSGLGPVSEPFELGDYGQSPRSLRVDVHVLHEGGGTDHEDTFNGFVPDPPLLRYAPPTASRPAPTAQTPGTQPASAGPPAAAVVPAAAPAADPAPVTPGRRSVRPVRSRGSVPNHQSAREIVRSAKPTVTVRVAPGAAAPARVTPALETAATAVSGREAVRSVVRHHSAPAEAPTVTRTRHAAAATVSRAGDDKVMTPARAAAARPRRARHEPGAPLAAIALLVLAALAGGGLGRIAWRRRTPPEQPPEEDSLVLMEAELQEIIAEHRAAETAPAPPTRTRA